MESISQRLKNKREEMNLSQAQLAELVGMTQQSLQAIEAGLTKRPVTSLNCLQPCIAILIGCSMARVLIRTIALQGVTETTEIGVSRGYRT
jgi:transcriptional regulator with XRE-family HTH domain